MGRSFQVLPGLMKFFVKLLTGFSELIHTLTQTFRQLGQLFCPEQNEDDDKNQHPFGRPGGHESNRMHTLNGTAGWDGLHPKPAGFLSLYLL